jgi:flagellar M-ring protein FliF
VPENASYVISKDKTPATASVVLNLERNTELNSRQIEGIEQLVAKSILGLSSGDVAIIDGNGMQLNRNSGDSGFDASTKLELEKNISRTIESNILRLMTPVFGQDAFRVVANANVEISSKVSEETKYSPVVGESGIISSQGITQESKNGGTAAGGIPGMSSNGGVTTYPETNASASDKSLSSTSNTNYLVNQMKEQVEKKGYEIKDITVAVLIGNNSLSEDDIEKYREMIAFAAGIETDKVSVTTAEFSSTKAAKVPAAEQEKGDLTDFVKENYIYLGAFGAFLILMLLLVILRKKIKKRRNKKATEDEDQEELGKLAKLKPKPEEIPGQIVLNETREQGLKRQIKDFSGASPDVVAQLLRTWIKEEDNRNG